MLIAVIAMWIQLVAQCSEQMKSNFAAAAGGGW